MYAIVDIAGQQFKVEAGKELFVNRLSAARILPSNSIRYC